MLLKIHPDNPDERKIRQAVKILNRDGLVVIPTDTVYSFACELGSAKGLERLARLKEIPLNQAKFSIACADLSQLSTYTMPLDNALFKIMRKTLPGPYTFILPASSMVPKWFTGKRKTIGIRVPDHPVTRALLQEIDRPLIVSSVRDEDDIVEYTTDPELIAERFADRVDAVVDGGMGHLHASTVVDCTGKEIVLVRQGLGETEGIFTF
ncbi:MAG: L-threonylcarbamoyladenylate synthase [Bacteroidetes bacterium]|jgi:tRNA threonylcarbamoyl adenosine modification protein (Sua5/YciO/YrdC/YwlC family)|nr:L-threonylcarbamoyladenylate synthase [Bacteroidota bacterium]